MAKKSKKGCTQKNVKPTQTSAQTASKPSQQPSAPQPSGPGSSNSA